MTEDRKDYGKLEYKIGQGKIIGVKNRKWYVGQVPFGAGEEAVIMRKQDYDLFIRGYITMLFSQKVDMPENIVNDFPDQIQASAKGGESVNLFLDRHFYVGDKTEHIMIRYESVSEALDEEDLTKQDPNAPHEQ